MNKKVVGIILSLVVIMASVAALAIGGATYAIWTTTSTATIDLDIPVDEYNPSEKYIVFKGLDSSGNLTDVQGSTVAYAVVGYDGLVAELIIPSTHNSLNVTKICIDSTAQNFAKRLAGNSIITSIYIPSTVTIIGNGACSDMALLESVTFEDGNSGVTMGSFAFGGCINLSTFTCSRTISGDTTTYLTGTNVS